MQVSLYLLIIAVNLKLNRCLEATLLIPYLVDLMEMVPLCTLIHPKLHKRHAMKYLTLLLTSVLMLDSFQMVFQCKLSSMILLPLIIE